VTRQERIAHHKKQERLVVQNGEPSIDEVEEGVPVLRDVSGKGLVEYVNYNNQLHEKKLKVPSNPITKLTNSTAGTANGSLLDTTVDNTSTDDLATIAAKINEIIEKIN